MKFFNQLSTINLPLLRIAVLIAHLPLLLTVLLLHTAEGATSALHGFTTGTLGAASVALQGFAAHMVAGMRAIGGDVMAVVAGATVVRGV